MLIYLSPSDQWTNPAAGSGHSEAYHCTQIAVAAKKYLEMYGYKCFIGDNTREGSYPARAKESNMLGADLHIAIHTNAGGGQGTEMICYPGKQNNPYIVNVYNCVASLTPTVDRGIRQRTNLYEVNYTNCTCVYIEVEFHDNQTYERWIDANIDNIGYEIAHGVCMTDGISMIKSETFIEAEIKPIKTTLGSVLANIKKIPKAITTAFRRK